MKLNFKQILVRPEEMQGQDGKSMTLGLVLKSGNPNFEEGDHVVYECKSTVMSLVEENNLLVDTDHATIFSKKIPQPDYSDIIAKLKAAKRESIIEIMNK